MLWHLWIGRARNPVHFAVEVFNVGGWLTHGDLAFDAHVDFLAVVEYRLIPARVRSEWPGLRVTVWLPFGRPPVRILPSLVVLYGYQGSLVCWLVISMWSPPKIPCLAKGISAGLWVDLEASWASASGVQLAGTCKRTWDSANGHRRDFMVGCTLAVAAVLSCKTQLDRWVAPHLAVRTCFDCCRSLWPGSWLPRAGVQSLWRFRGFGRFLMSVCSSWLDMMLFCWMSL